MIIERLMRASNPGFAPEFSGNIHAGEAQSCFVIQISVSKSDNSDLCNK